MTDIATVEEFASFLQCDLDTATANLLLLDLAQGLVAEVIGELDPWPVSAKAVALAAAARSYRNPEGVKRETVGGVTVEYNPEDLGVYLTDSELSRLQPSVPGRRGSMGTIRVQSGYPPVSRCEDSLRWRS